MFAVFHDFSAVATIHSRPLSSRPSQLPCMSGSQRFSTLFQRRGFLIERCVDIPPLLSSLWWRRRSNLTRYDPTLGILGVSMLTVSAPSLPCSTCWSTEEMQEFHRCSMAWDVYTLRWLNRRDLIAEGRVTVRCAISRLASLSSCLASSAAFLWSLCFFFPLRT